MFLSNKTIKIKKNYWPTKKSVKKTTQYGGDVVIFLLNKIIKNKKLNYPPKNVGLEPCARLTIFYYFVM